MQRLRRRSGGDNRYCLLIYFFWFLVFGFCVEYMNRGGFYDYLVQRERIYVGLELSFFLLLASYEKGKRTNISHCQLP